MTMCAPLRTFHTITLAAILLEQAAARRHSSPDERTWLNQQANSSAELWKALPECYDATARCEKAPGGTSKCYFKTCCGRWRWIGSVAGSSLCQVVLGVGNDFALQVHSDDNVGVAQRLVSLGKEFDEHRYRSSLNWVRSQMELASARLLGYAALAAMADESCALWHRGSSVSFQTRRLPQQAKFEINITFHRGSSGLSGTPVIVWDKDDDVRMMLPWSRKILAGDGGCSDVRRSLLVAWRFLSEGDTAAVAGLLQCDKHIEQLRRSLLRRSIPGGVSELADIATATINSYAHSEAAAMDAGAGPTGCSTAAHWSEYAEDARSVISDLTLSGFSKEMSHVSLASQDIAGGSHLTLEGLGMKGMGHLSLETLASNNDWSSSDRAGLAS
mmetsp:Transcript_121900/g.351997  ORF Transcript_121900/g.351997 Transcript_121900/m.351997 type:complete len:387 (+) Transcript_121900:116-1276(+)